MTLLHLTAVLALAATALAAPVAVDCGTTSFSVDGYLQKNFNLGPNANCVYDFSWRSNTGAFIESHVDGLDSDYRTSVAIFNDFVGGNNIRFGNQSGGSFLDEVNTYWAPGTVKLSITTGPNSNLAVKIGVSVSNSTKDAVVETTQVITGSQPIVVSDNLKLGTTYVYTSTSRIVLAVTTILGRFRGNGTYFDSVFVYDGQGPSAKLIGSLGQLFLGQSRLLQSNSLTLLPLSEAKLEGKVIINNQQNIGAFDSNNVYYYFSHNVDYDWNALTVDALGSLTGSIVSFGGNQTDYPIITRIAFSDDTAVLQVFSGLITNKMAPSYIKQYTSASADGMSPQSFPGTAITFTINRGYAVVSYTSALTPDAGKQ